jgi:hypothetical protein
MSTVDKFLNGIQLRSRIQRGERTPALFIPIRKDFDGGT